MAISSFSGINLALRGLLAQQAALDVTSHNITNADRAGYTRQEAVMAAAPALLLPQGAVQSGAGALLGQGVDVQEYRRIRDGFLDLQARAQEMALGQSTTTAGALGQVEDVLQEPGDGGLSALLGKLWSAWGDLANQPESSAAKAAVVSAAQNVVGRLQTLDGQLSALGTNAATQVAGFTAAGGPIDRIAQELGTLNTAITRSVEAGISPNDLLDRRDQLLDTLSSYGQVSVTDLGVGSISVSFGDAATPIVAGGTVTWPQAVTAATGGKVGALLTLSQTTIPAYRADLDAVAASLVSTVNGLHPTPVFGGTSAATISVVATVATIDASASAAPGANDAARALAALRGGAVDTGYADLVRRIGQDAATANAGEATAKAIRDQTEARRQSVAGVSMDEEMANMVRFQRGYQAAARAMTTLDEALDVLINRTGRVGL